MLPQVDWNSPREMGRNPPFFPVGTQWETRGKNAWRGLGTKGFAQKKVLSLVLCVAMLLSVMVMGTGAAFTDQDEIQNAEAVDMTSALGIIDGYEDGSFQPAENIERGEAAKMISAMLNGGRDSVQETTESSYNDVLGSVDAWANKYIEYCTARGIVSGVGGDRFAPASNVTGTQLAKMLLVSLGYDSVKEGYQDNAMWSVNVNTDAVAAGLYAGIETIDMSAPLSRDNAAQMIWNALQANTVVYLTDSTGAINIQDTTLLEKVYGAHVETGVMSHIDYNYDTKEYTYSIGDFNSYSTGNTVTNVEKYSSTKDFTDLYAMNVTVLVKGDEALMIRVNEGGTVVEGVWGDISATQNDHFNTINVNGEKYRLDNVAKDWKGFESITVAYNNFTTYHDLRDQYSFRAIDIDGGGDIDVIVVYPYVVLKTTNVVTDSFRTNIITANDAKMTVDKDKQDLYTSLGLGTRDQNTVEYDDVIVNGTVARDGYVMAVPAEYTATGVDTYTVLDIQSGVPTSLNTKDLMVTMGGTEYDGNLLEQVDQFRDISLGNTYSYVEVNDYLFVMDGTGLVPDMDQYVVVTAAENTADGVDKTYEANLLTTENTTLKVDVSYVNNWDNGIKYPVVGSMYTYEVNDAGYYELTAVTDNNNEFSCFDIQQVYKNGATLNDNNNVITNNGEADRYGTNSNGGFFKNENNLNQVYNFASDAKMFVYNRMLNSYSVVDGADLANLDPAEVTWAFTGANEVGSTNAYTVNLGYVAVDNNPAETTVYAYVNSTSDINRYQGEDGLFYVDIDVTLANGETATYTTAGTVQQMNDLYWRLYNWVEENNYVELIVDGTTLIDVKDYYVGYNTTVTAELVDSTIELNGQKYFVGDTAFISTVGGVETIADLENGDVVRVYAEKDSDDNLNIVMIGFDGIQEIFSTTQVTADASVNAFTVSATFNNGVLTVTMSKDTISDNADQFNLIITYADGTFETINTGVKTDGATSDTITFTVTPKADITGLKVAHA